MALNFITKWLTYNITPIFVFDGKNKPSEKTDTISQRYEDRMSTRKKIDDSYQELRDTGRTSIEELRKNLGNHNHITHEEFELFKTILRGIGIPVIQAAGEAEKLCTSLCREEKVAAVFSEDTDNLVYGCPLMITGFSGKFQLNCVRIDKVLQGLKMTYSTFIDLCIMSGCDYNANMPGYAIFNSYKLLLQYNSIDNLPSHLDISCLLHNRCREIFSYVASVNLMKDPTEPLNLNKNTINELRDYLDTVGVSGQIPKLIKIYEKFESSNDGLIDNLNLTRVTLPPKYLKLNIIGVF
jgi:5'-3' exonuclease